jgi:hypothetical protein
VKAALSKETVEESKWPRLEKAIEPGGSRIEPRIRVSCEVELEGEGFMQRGRVYDVSQHGLSVWVPRPRHIGQEIQVIDVKKRFQALALVRNSILLAGQWRIGLHMPVITEGWIFR